MFVRRVAYGLAAAVLGGVIVMEPVRADDAPPLVPLVVDLDGILDHSKAGEAVTAELTAHNKIFEKEHARQEGQLEQLQQQLEQEHATMAPDAFQQKSDDFQRRVQEWQQAEQLNERALGQATEEAREKILDVLHDIIGGIALERHANLILLQSQVFFYARAYDITQEVLARLDEKMPTLKVDIPKVTPQNQAAPPPGSDQGAANQ